MSILENTCLTPVNVYSTVYIMTNTTRFRVVCETHIFHEVDDELETVELTESFSTLKEALAFREQMMDAGYGCGDVESVEAVR